MRYPLKREPRARTKKRRKIKRRSIKTATRRRDTVVTWKMAGKRRGRRVTARELRRTTGKSDYTTFYVKIIFIFLIAFTNK